MGENMDLEELSFEEMLKGAVKAEINSQEVYEHLADRSENFVITDRFEFLAGEEKKHENFLRELYESYKDTKELDVPDKTAVPLPYIRYDESIDESEIIDQAMDAEVASRDFYRSMADKAIDVKLETNPKKLLNYLADMEQNHYEILKKEFDRMSEFEEFDEYHPAMHQGP